MNFIWLEGYSAVKFTQSRFEAFKEFRGGGGGDDSETTPPPLKKTSVATPPPLLNGTALYCQCLEVI